VDRSRQPAPHDRKQRRRRQRFDQRRPNLDRPAVRDGATLSRRRHYRHSLSRLRRAAGQLHHCTPSTAGGRGGRGAANTYGVGGGESGYIAPDPRNPNIFFAGSQGALLTRYDRRTNYSRDVQVYPLFFSGESAGSLPERWQWTYPIVFSPVNPDILYTSSQHLWKTTDDGHSWTRISGDLTRADPKTLGDSGGPITHDQNGPEIYGTIFTIAPSRKDVNTIWTGSDDGLIYITRDGDSKSPHWTKITPPGMPDFGRVSLIDASPHNPGAAYVAVKNYQNDDRHPYIFKTADYGKTWTKIVTGIPENDFVHAVREDPVRQGLLFAGTEHGIYVSFDDGAQWQSIALNLPDVQVSDIVIQGADVVIATHGRSFYVLDDISPLRQLKPTLLSESVHLFQPPTAERNVEQARIDYYLAKAAEKVHSRYPRFQRPGGPHVQRHSQFRRRWTQRSRWTRRWS
jgi:hypothetical protein